MRKIRMLCLKSIHLINSGDQAECPDRGVQLPPDLPAQTRDPDPGGVRLQHLHQLHQLRHAARLSSAELQLCAGQPGQVNSAN